MFGDVKLPEYPPMFSTTVEHRRATLALTYQGPVLGVPDGTPPDEAAQAEDRVEAWWDGRDRVLVLPWPVDVVDLRGQMHERTK